MERETALGNQSLHTPYTQEYLDATYGPHPDHASASTEAELLAEAEAMAGHAFWEPELDDDSCERCGMSHSYKEQIEPIVRRVVSTSRSDEEIKRRLTEELGYDSAPCISSLLPTDKVGREARFLVACLGGLIRGDGAMVMIMMYAPCGEILDF